MTLRAALAVAALVALAVTLLLLAVALLALILSAAMVPAAAMVLAAILAGRRRFRGGCCRLVRCGCPGAIAGRLRGGLGRLVATVPAAAALAFAFARPRRIE